MVADLSRRICLNNSDSMHGAIIINGSHSHRHKKVWQRMYFLHEAASISQDLKKNKAMSPLSALVG
jgi:hypothetical protein